MADTKITALTALTGADPANDVIPIVDVSDTTMAASGTTKKISVNNILGASGTATLASATITGGLTVGNGTSATQTFSGVTNILDIGFGSLRGGSAYGDVRLWTDRFRIYNNAGTQIIKNISGTNGDETWYDGAGGTRMTLNSTGLGVGASPASGIKLNVHQGGSTSAYLKISNGDTGNGTGDGFDIIVNNAAGNYKTNFLLRETGAMAFWTDSTERLLIDATGNVGIGVTPSAWASYKALQVGSIGSLSSVTGATIVGNNWFYDGASKYITTAASTIYEQGAGTHVWFNAPSGTAGNAITFTQAMTLDASGNLLIGKTATNYLTVGCELKPNGAVQSTQSGSTNANSCWDTYSTGAGAYRFYVGMAGTVFATNTTISAISDARLKENVQDIDVGLGAILALKPRKFDWKDGKGKNIKGDRGFIAQEFETVFPNLIDEWKENAPEGEAPYKSVRQDLIPVLVKAIQELTARVQTLETR